MSCDERSLLRQCDDDSLTLSSSPEDSLWRDLVVDVADPMSPDAVGSAVPSGRTRQGVEGLRSMPCTEPSGPSAGGCIRWTGVAISPDRYLMQLHTMHDNVRDHKKEGKLTSNIASVDKVWEVSSFHARFLERHQGFRRNVVGQTSRMNRTR